MKVLIAGSTTWENADSIRNKLTQIPTRTTVVHGDAPGADVLGGQIAAELGLAVEPFAKCSEDYQRYQRGAWKALNERMLASGVELVLAFHPAIEKSKGTRHLVNLANKSGIPVEVVEKYVPL